MMICQRNQFEDQIISREMAANVTHCTLQLIHHNLRTAVHLIFNSFVGNEVRGESCAAQIETVHRCLQAFVSLNSGDYVQCSFWSATRLDSSPSCAKFETFLKLSRHLFENHAPLNLTTNIRQ
uniref:Uncharacterized protein n=1 Tax=Romanomermis culicivorax TaxID=13658 RepID=A0A915HY04_ROMCU